MPWPAVIFGWPAVFLAVAAFGVALLTPRTWMGFIGASLAAPFCLFVSGYPLFHRAGQVALAANVLAAYLLHRGRRDMAFTLLLPFMMIVTVLAVFALRDIRLVGAAIPRHFSSQNDSEAERQIRPLIAFIE